MHAVLQLHLYCFYVSQAIWIRMIQIYFLKKKTNTKNNNTSLQSNFKINQITLSLLFPSICSRNVNKCVKKVSLLQFQAVVIINMLKLISCLCLAFFLLIIQWDRPLYKYLITPASHKFHRQCSCRAISNMNLTITRGRKNRTCGINTQSWFLTIW